MPLVYTRHTARFLSMWLLLLPFGLYDSFGDTWNHVGLIPAAAVLSIFLFGIEELAVQLEEPFSILPLEAMCNDVRGAAADMVDGMPSARAPLRRRAPDAQMVLSPTDAAGAGSVLLSALSPVEQGERYALAGGLCASLSHALACPIDVVKTRQQTPQV